MHLKTRRVHIAGITPSPNATWMTQVCRNLTDCEDGFLKDASHLIVDRDTSLVAMRDFIDQNTETEVVLLPPKSPNLNAYMERWFRSLKSECLERMIFFGPKSLENAVREYVQQPHNSIPFPLNAAKSIQRVESAPAREGFSLSLFQYARLPSVSLGPLRPRCSKMIDQPAGPASRKIP